MSSLIGILVDLWILATKCDFIVGTFSSNVGELFRMWWGKGMEKGRKGGGGGEDGRN